MNASVLKGLERFISDSNKAYCYSIVHEWRNHEDNSSLWDLCRSVEQELQLPSRFDKQDIETLLTADIFPSIHEVILSRFYSEVADHVVKTELMLKTAENRRTSGWYDQFSYYYDCLYFVAKMQEFYQDNAAGFHIVEPKSIWKLYADKGYEMDNFYRHFHYAFGCSLKDSNPLLEDKLKHAAEYVEAVYQNWFLKELTGCWTNAISDNLASLGYVSEIGKQRNFYAHYIKSLAGKNSRAFVIISDALRYEVASELCDTIVRTTKGTAKLDAVQAVFPSITKFGMEFYDVNFSYIDAETFEERYVSVPEQGGGKLIPEGMCNPGQVYTISQGKSGMLGAFRLESQMLPGNGKFERTGIGSDTKSKEATNTAFNYLKANASRISGSISTTTKDYIINYQDLQGIGMTDKLALPTLIALSSIALGKPTISGLAVLGEISISGTMIKVEELANTLQVCLDSGAKKVLLPITSAADLGTVPSELIGCFNLIFYQSAEDAVYKALGVE